LACLSLLAWPASAAEPAREFVEGLRQRGYFEEAMAYLEQMRGSRLTDASFQEVIDYEAGVTLMDRARAARRAADREALLRQAHERLAQFLAAHPRHPLAAAAQAQLAEVLVERGRLQAEQARLLDTAGQQRRRAMAAVRDLYQQAQSVFLAAEKQSDDASRKFPRFIDPHNGPLLAQREQVRRDLLQTRLALARVVLEIARTYEPGTAENRAGLQEAAKRYGSLYEKHNGELAGLYARLGQARCYQELGDVDRALALFTELLAQPNEPEALALLKSQTTRLALESALAPRVGKYREALAIYEAWQRAPHHDESASAESLAIQYFAGEAALYDARRLHPQDKDQGPLRSQRLQTARRAFAAVARWPGEYQAKAKARLADPLLGAVPEKLPEPTSFADARDRARAAMQRMALAESEADLLAAGAVASADKEQLRQQIVAARREALRYDTLALQLPAGDRSDDDLGWIRYDLAYLHFKAGDLDEAAATGADLARLMPEHPQARLGARIALAAHAALLNQADTERARRAAREQLLAIADLIVRRWEGEPEAVEAWMVLLENAVADGRLERAGDCLQHIPAAFKRRSEGELLLGRAAWSAWLAAWRLPQPQRPPQPELDKLLARARQLLSDGLGRAIESPAVDGTGATAVVALAQLELSMGQADRALAWLKDARVGLLRPAGLLDDRPTSPTEETFRIALQAYVASQRWEQAEAALHDLEPVGRDAAAIRQATQTMIRCGRDLQQQAQRLRAQKKTAALAELQAFWGRFLWQVADRPQGNTFFSLDFVAEAYFALGVAFDGPRDGDSEASAKPPKEAGEYYLAAADAYRKLLRQCEAAPRFSPHADAVVAIKIRLARCLRRLGGDREARDLLVGVLKDHPGMIDAQVEAAYTYQAWGAEQPDYYLLAITGSQQYREIWGWGQLAERLAQGASYRETCCEAHYNLALCRLRLAESTAAGAEREQWLQQAKADIFAARGFCSGSKSWYDKCDALWKSTLRRHP
jgi:hypothetical protein